MNTAIRSASNRPRTSIARPSRRSHRNRTPGNRSRHDFTAEESAQMAGHIYLVQPLIALIAGILILIVPRILNYVVALYLIIVGVVGLFGAFQIPGT